MARSTRVARVPRPGSRQKVDFIMSKDKSHNEGNVAKNDSAAKKNFGPPTDKGKAGAEGASKETKGQARQDVAKPRDADTKAPQKPTR
jgi:uncharacterized protein YjbJ (UPF0337 family)